MQIYIADRSPIHFKFIFNAIRDAFPWGDPEKGPAPLLFHARDGMEILSLLRKGYPDFLFLSDTFPGHQLQMIRDATKEKVKTCIIARKGCPYNCRIAISAGATGYLSIDTPIYEFESKLRDFLRGKVAVDDETRLRLGDQQIDLKPDHILSDREWQVAQFLAQGYTCQEVADFLFLSEKTIQSHRANILNKLGLSNVTKLALYAVKSGMIQPYMDTSEGLGSES